VYASRGLNVE